MQKLVSMLLDVCRWGYERVDGGEASFTYVHLTPDNPTEKSPTQCRSSEICFSPKSILLQFLVSQFDLDFFDILQFLAFIQGIWYHVTK